ncbi:MAG: MgtC/SapB family protein, partial [Butyricicoccaceae bacterium]
THMLVAIGSALVMLTGEYLSAAYSGTANSDPARLGAQVISGIGFLGAGTILKEGVTIRGLTTAASLWTTACIGLAVGSGFLFGGLIAALATMITLTIIERMQRRISGSSRTGCQITLLCKDAPETLREAGRIARDHHQTITHTHILETPDGFSRLILHIEPHGRQSCHISELTAALAGIGNVRDIQSERIL